MLLLYNEAYTVLLCDRKEGFVKTDQAGFDASDYARSLTANDGSDRVAYQIPYNATEENCYLFANAYEILGKSGVNTPVVSIASNTLRVKIEEAF